MRTLAITQNITLDGSIEILDDWFSPPTEVEDADEDLLAETRAQSGQSDTMLLGRRTFEDFRSYWPLQRDDPTGVAEYLDDVDKYVVSSTLRDPGWQNATILGGDPIEQVRTLKAGPGLDIVTTGSITLCHSLIEAGLVDEYRLFVYPVVQGRGRGLFPDGYTTAGLRLLDARRFRGGVALTRYEAP
ncbi:dihydrofolate reductase family protein [Rhodococcus sp. (in: high G+C Gram-positive bacteria)]|uniref:dihydrofolate reductase family protein n=1 Tax=Rhodococcus sp. TaxID=1831 RepID=UPI003F05FA86